MLFKIGLQTEEHNQYWYKLRYIDKLNVSQHCIFITPEEFYEFCNFDIQASQHQFKTIAKDITRMQSLYDYMDCNNLLPVPVISLVGTNTNNITPKFFDGLHRMMLSYELYGNKRQPVIIITEANKPEQIEVIKNGTKHYNTK